MQASEAISSASMRYISENIQFSRMKNIFPQSSSHLYGYGFSEAAVSEIPQQIDSKLNAYDSSFYMDSSELHNQTDQIGGVFTICSQPPTVNYQSGPSSVMTINRLDCPSFGTNHFTAMATFPAYDSNIKQQQQLSNVERVSGQTNDLGTIRSTRKRPIEKVDITVKRSPEVVAGNRQSPSDQWMTNKMAMSFQEKKQILEHKVQKEIKQVQKDRVPVRRSQKVADKITALQKLVSPYGKTDTASVLHEASVFIKVLQDQIESAFHSEISTSMEDEYPQSKIQQQLTGERPFELRSKGFCLVPVSLTKNLIKEDSLNHYSTTNIPLPRNTLTHF